MAVTHDWECEMHGAFEAKRPENTPSGKARTPRCPHGCHSQFVHLVFLKAVGTRSNVTKYTDAEMYALAKSYGMTDIANNRGGDASSVVNTALQNGDRKDSGALWIDVPHASPGFSRGGKPLVYDPRPLSNTEAVPGFVPGDRSPLGAPAPQYVVSPTAKDMRQPIGNT